MMDNKNEKLLYDFIYYCIQHPELRFWQALKNWSKYNFIYGSMDSTYKLNPDHLEDTFYLEEK